MIAHIADLNPTSPTDHGKRYVGIMDEDGLEVTVHRADGTSYPLPLRLDLRNHSPNGFSHGYSGSGCAQLALALCADATGNDEMARDIYQSVKRDVVARLNGDAWELTQGQVLDAVKAVQQGRGR